MEQSSISRHSLLRSGHPEGICREAITMIKDGKTRSCKYFNYCWSVSQHKPGVSLGRCLSTPRLGASPFPARIPTSKETFLQEWAAETRRATPKVTLPGIQHSHCLGRETCQYPFAPQNEQPFAPHEKAIQVSLYQQHLLFPVMAR